MAVSIKTIRTTHGPLESFDDSFGKMTLVYGPNMSGKTSLEESILMALCPKKEWQSMELRCNEFPAGKSSVTLDIDGELHTFTNYNKDTLAQIVGIDKSNLSLLPLFVKGSETAISKGRPLSKEDLYDILQFRKMYENIEKNIEDTIKNKSVTFEHDAISGHGSTRFVKKSNELRKDIEDIDEYLSKIECSISGSEYAKLEMEKESLAEELESIEKARRHYAYELSEKIAKHSKMIERSDVGKLEDVLFDLNTINNHHSESENEITLKMIRELEKKGIWVDKALERIYELDTIPNDKKTKNLLYASIAFSIITIITTIMTRQVLFSLIGIISIMLTYLGMMKSCPRSVICATTQGYESIKKDIYSFLRKNQLIDDTAPDSPLYVNLNSAKAKINADTIRLKGMLEKIHSDHEKIKSLETETSIFFSLHELPYDTTSTENNIETVKTMIEGNKERVKKITHYETILESLSINEAEYLIEYEGEQYNYMHAETSKESYLHISERLRELEGAQKILFNEAKKFDFNPTSWKHIITHLNDMLDEKKEKLRQLNASLIAQEICNNLLQEQESMIEAEINSVLDSDDFSDILQNYTKAYSAMQVNSDKEVYLVEKNTNEHHLISQVSSGARERAMMALRVALARRMYGKTPLFFILDDAFIFSDDDGRESMIDTFSFLLDEGWQIIYLTKDVNVRRLFSEKYGKREDYKEISLKATS